MFCQSTETATTRTRVYPNGTTLTYGYEKLADIGPFAAERRTFDGREPQVYIVSRQCPDNVQGCYGSVQEAVDALCP